MGSIEATSDLCCHEQRRLRCEKGVGEVFAAGEYVHLRELYSTNVTAKILRTATRHLKNNNPPIQYPGIVPQSGEGAGRYKTHNIDFWTCGFFPGSIYSLLERTIKYPHHGGHGPFDLQALRQRFGSLGRTWSDPIHGESRLTNTHDLGFIMMPHMRPRWELFHDERALQSIITAAENLYTRYSPTVGAIRSWDELVWQNAPHITGTDDNFIVIIDSMCNLNLLYYAAAHTGHKYLSDAATNHARALTETHLRQEPSRSRPGFSGMLYSSSHMVNFCPKTGDIKERRSVQGYDTNTTWSRGQAWAILGYAETYTWTRQEEFLDIACGLAEYFLLRMELAPKCVEIQKPDGTYAGRYVPVWDFDAPLDSGTPPLRDTAAGTAAACGMLIIYEALIRLGRFSLGHRYLHAALRIVNDTIAYSLAEERARLSLNVDGEIEGVDIAEEVSFEGILKNATVSNNPLGYVQIKDHGLVYADYYLIEFGTMLLRLGLV